MHWYHKNYYYSFYTDENHVPMSLLQPAFFPSPPWTQQKFNLRTTTLGICELLKHVFPSLGLRACFHSLAIPHFIGNTPPDTCWKLPAFLQPGNSKRYHKSEIIGRHRYYKTSAEYFIKFNYCSVLLKTCTSPSATSECCLLFHLHNLRNPVTRRAKLLWELITGLEKPRHTALLLPLFNFQRRKGV